jgi:molybdopterin-containing oxidoreductase family iron-sulfur binding subunit
MNNKKVYWQGVEQLKNDPEFVKNASKEFVDELPVSDAYGDNVQQNEDVANPGRRDFLKMMGFSVAAVSLAACEAPIKKAIPYLNKPENADPSISDYYASTYMDGSDYAPVVVKVKDGRPISVEGNSFSSLTKGGITSRASASVLSLYDIEKIKYPTKQGAQADWDTLDSEISAKLQEIASSSGAIRIVSNTIASPSTLAVIGKFIKKYPSTQHVIYDTDSLYALRLAHKNLFGKDVIPSFNFEKVKTVVSIAADFLGEWLSPLEHSAAWAKTRRLESDGQKEMSRLYCFESMLSITGASADHRQPFKPSQLGLVIAKLYDSLAGIMGGQPLGLDYSSLGSGVKKIELAAKDLAKSRENSLVVCGTNNEAHQTVVAAINQMLGCYGSTIDTDRPILTKQGDDEKMSTFISELKSGTVKAVIFYNCNPVYDHPQGEDIKTSIGSAQLSISTADRLSETSSLTLYNCPDRHYLESWNDAEPKRGYFSLCQPAITPIFKYRQVQDSLMKWAGMEGSYELFVKQNWISNLKQYSNETDGQQFWVRSLHDGVFEVEAQLPAIQATAPVNPVLSSFSTKLNGSPKDKLELLVYTSTIMGNGSQANNPILQEIPDPITKMCWGNFIAVPMSRSKDFPSFETKASLGKVTIRNRSFTLPVIVQPGLANDTIAIMTGYGRDASAGKVTQEAGGYNAYQLLTLGQTVGSYLTDDITLEAVGNKEMVAQTQTHHTIMGRETIIQESTLDKYQKDTKAGRFYPKISRYSGKSAPGNISVWDIKKDGFGKQKISPKEDELNLWANKMNLDIDKYKYYNHHWGMMIDLNTCTGCSACITACNVENNVPVVGKLEVARRREMHWLRIDRYYSSKEEATSYTELEEVAENPEVVFQPMMCQHCNNAPCETVCPVAATTHSSEGLNQMTYNRCVGTKYCANNCPYKVRRFNWFLYNNNNDFDYHMNNSLGKMVLNPDVTVRSRGVMEKCSLCIQRIQEAKLKAKREKRRLGDGEFNTACASACPTNAITFGDLNNTESKIRKRMDVEIDARAYNVLEEINVSPNVWYLTKIRNKEENQA